MRSLVLATAVLAACASSGDEIEADAIDVVYVPEAMYYTIEDGGRARVVGAEGRVFDFDASRADFRRIADLLAPLQAEGLPCVAPPERVTPGYIAWRRGGEEVRQTMYTLCYGEPPRLLERNTHAAWDAMVEMARARYVAPVIPEPAIIAVEYLSWGNRLASWSVSRAGEGRFTEGDRTQTFAVSDERFNQIRDIFRPYESRWFECERAIYDMPYGAVVWSSREGQEDQRTAFDGGCTTGDADDLFERLERANAMVDATRGAER